MKLSEIQKKSWILALVIREDGERILLGDGAFMFKSNQLQFPANTIVNDTIDIQGGDGTLLAGQVRRSGSQSFDGYIGDQTTNKQDTEQLRRDFIQFFATGKFYTVVYIATDGTAIQRRRGFIVDSPTASELFQVMPEYHVALNFEDVNYYKYAENSEGDEIYSSSIEVPNVEETEGGLVWDEDGATWGNLGAVWEGGSGGVAVVTINATANTYVVWTVGAGAQNPTLENLTTGQTMKYNGTVAEGQTLVVDTFNQTVKLNGLSVIDNFDGDWMFLVPQDNSLSYNISGGESEFSTLEWNEVVG